RIDLRLHAYAAVDQRGLQRNVFAVGTHAVFDLRRELARRRDDQRTDRMTGRRMAAVRLRAQELKQRQGEAGGLTRAGLCRAEQVLACEHDGNGLRLDGGGLGIALFGYSTKQLGLEAKGIK